MRLATFLAPDETPAGPTTRQHTGVVDGDDLVDLNDPVIGLPADMTALLTLGDEAWERAATAAATSARRWGLEQVELLAPVTLPPKVLAIGRNYLAHVTEMGGERPVRQLWFNKQRTAVTGPSADILVPAVSEQVDYEGELGLVIRRRAKSVPAARWLDVVAGFTVGNDVSVRDWQAHSPTFTIGKSFDTHCPLGPWIVTPDEVGDPHTLDMRLFVNGDLRQQSYSGNMSVTIPELIAHHSPLGYSPGDVLTTGTVSGVAGFKSDAEKWYLRPGDVVECTIDRVGTLRNQVVSWEKAHGSPPPPFREW